MPELIAYANKGANWGYMSNSRIGSATGNFVQSCGTDFSNLIIVAYGFDMPVLPPDGVVSSAVFEVYATGGLPTYNDGGQKTATQFYKVNGAWTESQSNYPPSWTNAGYLSTDTGTNGSWLTYPVSESVIDHYNGTTLHGLIWGNNDFRDNYFNHAGYDQTNKPRIRLQYSIKPKGYHMMM